MAGEEGPLELLAVKFPADEDDAAFAFFIVFPWPLVITLDNHVHALDHIAVIVAVKSDDSLESENVGAFQLGDLFDPWEETLRIDRACAQRNRLDGQVVDGGGSRVIVVIVVIMAVTMMRMIGISTLTIFSWRTLYQCHFFFGFINYKKNIAST